MAGGEHGGIKRKAPEQANHACVLKVCAGGSGNSGVVLHKVEDALVGDVEYPSSPDTCTQGINHMEIEHYEAGLAPLGPTDVRVAIKAVGICGSDVHYLKVRLGLRVNIEYCAVSLLFLQFTLHVRPCVFSSTKAAITLRRRRDLGRQ
jgi:hypothetical protein